MRNLIMDLRHALRLLWKTPGFSLAVVLTLALGIGANTAIFSVVNAVLLQPLPYRDAEQLVRAVRVQPTSLATIASYPDYTDWRDSGAFESATALVGRAYFLETGGELKRVVGARVNASFFRVLGVKPVIGRDFVAEEETRGEPVAIISHRLWRDHFAGDPQVTSRTLELAAQLQDGVVTYRIIAVLPENFRDPISPVSGRDIYSPLTATAEEATSRNSQWLHLIARLKPGVSLEQAKSIVGALYERNNKPGQDIRNLPKFTVVPLRELQVGDTRKALWLLLAAVGFVLLIACANVSNLLLARANARGHEMAIRAAIGASRRRLMAQTLTESLLLASLGGAAGIVLLLWGIEGLKRVAPADIPRLDQVSLNVPVLAFAALTTLFCGVLFGLLPSLRSAGAEVIAAMKSTRSSGDPRKRRAFSTLLVGEVALTMVLLAGAALSLQSLTRMLGVDVGFERANVLTISTIHAGKWEPAKQRLFYQQFAERVRALPGVSSVGVVDNLPLSGSWSQYTTNYQSFLQKFPPEKADTKIEYQAGVVFGDYFRAMGIPLRAGRWFAPAAGGENAPAEVLVSEKFAAEIWGKENPVGQRVNIGGQKPRWAEVVGVVGDVKHSGLDAKINPTLYSPFGVRESWGGTLVVRSRQNPAPLIAAVRQAVRELDRNVVIQRVRTYDDYFAEQTAAPRFLAVLLGSFAGLATLLAMVGTYGVLAYAVGQRTQEIGIRLALGGTPSSVLWMVLRNGMGLVAVGVLLGSGAAFWLSRYLRTLLFEVNTASPLTYAAVASSLLAAALLACYLPARRAAKTDPMVALRYE